MRILYGVCGQGMGHAVRSSVVISALSQQGHDVRPVATSREAADYVSKKTSLVCKKVLGPLAVYRNNRLRPAETFLEGGARALLSSIVNLPDFTEILRWGPDAVVSDFEGWSAYCAHRLKIPLVGLDNVHFANRCEHASDVALAKDDRARRLLNVAVDRMVPGAKQYLVTTFARPLSVRPSTSLHLPVLRPEVIALRGQTTQRPHLLSYLGSYAAEDAVLRAYAASGLYVHHYGKPGIRRPEHRGRVTLLPFSERAFLEDLVSARGVVCSAGFTLLSEAIYLGKPVMAVPLRDQYEQILNAQYLDRLGYGMRADRVDEGNLATFQGRIPACAERLVGLPFDDNRGILSALTCALGSARGSSARALPGRAQSWVA